MGYKITIDGPAGTGKGTLANILAKEYNIANVDSGSLYRSFGLYAIRNNINPEDLSQVEDTLKNVEIELKEDKTTGKLKPYINDEDVSMYIRTEEVAKITSKFAALKCVREYIAERQRRIANGRNIVMEGRDIGSVVFPDADLKIFLTATIEERAKRRYNEIIQKGGITTYEEVYEIIATRDHRDSTREVSPLIKTEDMIEIDSTHLTIDEVANVAKELMRKRGLN